jgi:hypothetical protein
MAVKRLSQNLGIAGACLDKSHGGEDRVYDLLKALIEAHQETVTQFNQFRTDYNASTSPTTATALTVKAEVA